MEALERLRVTGVAVAVKCHYCSKQRPAFRVHQLAGNSQIICDVCLEWHQRALELLAGEAMPGCQGCGATWEYLRDSTVGQDVRLYAVPCDGVYQVLCAACVKTYLPKRADLYKGTPFGSSLHM